jgi:predicted RNase H-like HicB family nuclease
MTGLSARQLAGLPWTYVGPVEVAGEQGEHFVLTVAELPYFFLASDSREDLLRELPVALEAFLQSYLDAGQSPPLVPLGSVAGHPARHAHARAGADPAMGRELSQLQ